MFCWEAEQLKQTPCITKTPKSTAVINHKNTAALSSRATLNAKVCHAEVSASCDPSSHVYY